MPEQGAKLARLQRTAHFIEKNGLPRPSANRLTTWMILVAHASARTDHWHAQANAQLLLDAEGIDRQLTNHHPCVVLGVPAARRYFVDKGYLRLLLPFRPACVVHDTNYVECTLDCVYGVKLDGRWVDELVGSTLAADSDAEAPSRPLVATKAATATRNESAPGVDLEVTRSARLNVAERTGFLAAMEAEARALEAELSSPGDWAKPFYSSVATMTPGTVRVFIGLNGAGDRFANQYDMQDGNNERVWKDPNYNAFLDDRWGDEHRASPVGTSPLQRYVLKVFNEMYGDDGRARCGLRPVLTSCPSVHGGKTIQSSLATGTPGCSGE